MGRLFTHGRCAPRRVKICKRGIHIYNRENFDDSGEFDYSVRNRFPTRLKSKEVEVEQEIMGKETVNAKLSSRAVVKEQGLGDVCLHKRRATQVETQLERRLNLEQDAESHWRTCRSGFEGNRGQTSISTLETT